jgi:hypothetical protein
MVDLMLMHQFATVTSLKTFPTSDARVCWQTIVPQYAERHPVIMHGLLAIAALDMAKENHEKRTVCRTRAFHHQQAGLAGFHGMLIHQWVAEVNAVFIFSVILIVLSESYFPVFVAAFTVGAKRQRTDRGTALQPLPARSPLLSTWRSTTFSISLRFTAVLGP